MQFILNYLIKQNGLKLESENAKGIVNEISKTHNIKKGLLMKSHSYLPTQYPKESLFCNATIINAKTDIFFISFLKNLQFPLNI